MGMHGRKHSEETKRKIGISNSKALVGRKLSEKHKANIKIATIKRGAIPPIHIGSSNKKWKGDAVGYDALHDWVRRQLGNPQKCEHCGTCKKKMYHWANKSGDYKRELDDWIRLCVPCHSKYDKKC